MSSGGRSWFVLALVVASCGGSSRTDVADDVGAAVPTAPSVAAPTVAEQPDAVATIADQPDVVPIEIAPCDVVTTEEVEAATSLVVESVSEESSGACLFDFGADVGVAVFVTLDDGTGSSMGPANVFAGYADRVSEGAAEQIADVGADAVYSSSFRGLAVDVGDGRFFAVGVNGGYSELSDPRDSLIAIAVSVLDRL